MNGFERFDVVKGTVVGSCRNGVFVKAEGIDANCFCRCGMAIGDVALFTIKRFIETSDELCVFLECDCILEYAPIAC